MSTVDGNGKKRLGDRDLARYLEHGGILLAGPRGWVRSDQEKTMNDDSRSISGSQSPAYTSSSSESTTGIRLTDNTAAVLAYFTIFPALLFLLFPTYNRVPYVRFHCIQSILFWIVASAIHAGLVYVPVFGVLLSVIATTAMVCHCIYTILRAGHGYRYKMVLVGKYAESLAGE